MVGRGQLGYAALMAFIMPILLPMQTQELVGKDNKVGDISSRMTEIQENEHRDNLLQGTALGVVLGVGTVISTLVGLGVSQWSDHTSTRFVLTPLASLFHRCSSLTGSHAQGKRAPFVFTTSMILALAASAMAW